MLSQEALTLPNVLRIGGYLVYFWTNENLEPIHVHISEGKATENATKIWLTKAGGAVVASNGSRIPTNKLNKILEVIIDNHFYICLKWKEMFGQDTLAFYC